MNTEKVDNRDDSRGSDPRQDTGRADAHQPEDGGTSSSEMQDQGMGEDESPPE